MLLGPRSTGALWSLVGTPVLHTFVIPEAGHLSVNPRVLGFMLVVGLAPGCSSAGASFTGAADEYHYRASRGRWNGGDRRPRGPDAQCVCRPQIALSLVLLVGAGLFLRTVRNAYTVDLG